MSTERKILAIGLDAATFDLIDPWVKAGQLPAFGRCLTAGTRADLRSTPLSNSAQAWSSFITGKNPGKHGIYDFFEPRQDGYGVRFINASFRKGKSLWGVLGEAGKRVVVINVPITYPAEAVNGVLIAGLDAPGVDRRIAHPPEILREIRERVGPYRVEAGVWGFMRNGRPDLALEGLLETIESRAATAKYLMAREPWDFFQVVFTETDKVQHHFWKYVDPSRAASVPPEERRYGEAIFRVYQRLDEVIGELCALAPADVTVLLMSDHGAGPSSHRTLYINRWLAHEGFLTYREPGGGRGAAATLLDGALRGSDLFLKKVLPRRAKEHLLRFFPGVRDRVDSMLQLGGIDWSQTVAYSRENHPAIFINRKGREPGGIVEPGEPTLRVRQEIVDRLLELRCAESGEPIVDRVTFGEEVFHGPESWRGPDILFSFRGHAYVQRPSGPDRRDGFLKLLTPAERERAEITDRPSGIHRDLGVFVAAGPAIPASREIGCVDLLDVTPTILYLLGVPVPDDMDGRVLVELFAPAFVEANPVRIAPSGPTLKGPPGAPSAFEEDEERIIRERLEGLGYID